MKLIDCKLTYLIKQEVYYKWLRVYDTNRYNIRHQVKTFEYYGGPQQLVIHPKTPADADRIDRILWGLIEDNLDTQPIEHPTTGEDIS